MTPEFAAAFVALQADLPTIVKDSTNPHFKNKYASLDAIVETLRPILAKHKFAVTQSAEAVRDGLSLIVTTTLVHASGGESHWNSVYVPVVKQDAQGAGGALTYGRRYGLSALFCLATDEDDDGNAASRAPQARKAAPRPESSPTPSEPATRHAGAPADRRFKGRRLGDVKTEELEQILKWARKTDAKDLADDIGSILADRSLGNDADTVVDRMKAAVDKDTAELPFK